MDCKLLFLDFQNPFPIHSLFFSDLQYIPCKYIHEIALISIDNLENVFWRYAFIDAVRASVWFATFIICDSVPMCYRFSYRTDDLLSVSITLPAAAAVMYVFPFQIIKAEF